MNHSEPIENKTPVYFLDLSVENVRCFGEEQTLDLSNGNGRPARWTVLLGDNGTGKTTLLRCLVTLEPFVSNYQDILFAFPKGTSNNFLFWYINEEREFIIKTSKFYKGTFDQNIAGYSNGFFMNRYKGTSLPANEVENLLIYAYGASRQMGTGSLSDTQNPDASASLFDKSIHLINAEEWFLQTDFTVKNSEGEIKDFAQKRFDKVKFMLLELLPDVQEIRIKPITKTQLKAIIEVKTPYGWIAMKDLSLGYQSVVAWTVDVASRLLDRYPDSDHPLAEPAVVLVDEIDLHLHPQWQRTLIQKLTSLFPNTQFIVTAHSPLIVQSAPDANIVLLRREGNQVKIYNRNEHEMIRGWRVDQILTSDLFDLPSARPAEYDDYLKRREEILGKKKLSVKDKEELVTIGKKLDEFSVVIENKEDSEAMQIIRKAAQILKSKG